MGVVKHHLITGDGYIILEKLIPEELIDSILAKQDTLYPVRASSSNKKYAESDDIKTLPDISVWWSQFVMDWPEIKEIENILTPYILPHLPQAKCYSSDIVTINAGSSWINPHVDTPHRFKKYNFNKSLLGIQAIVALSDLDKTNGATGLVPKSQMVDYNIDFCYRGLYTEFFLKNCIQPTMPKGSVLFYNCRVLHSSMPNPTKINRPALLLNYLDGSIIEDVKSLDNIWISNGTKQ